MKKLVFSLALLSTIAIAQPGFAAGSVIDQCPHTDGNAWKCAAIIDWQLSVPSWSPSQAWDIFYRYWF